jgi:hypothetical protein
MMTPLTDLSARDEKRKNGRRRELEAAGSCRTTERGRPTPGREVEQPETTTSIGMRAWVQIGQP